MGYFGIHLHQVSCSWDIGEWQSERIAFDDSINFLSSIVRQWENPRLDAFLSIKYKTPAMVNTCQSN